MVFIKKQKIFLLLTITTISALGFLTIHARVQTTILGYQIGHLKKKEAILLKKKNLLTMQVAKITSKKNLLKKLTKKTLK